MLFRRLVTFSLSLGILIGPLAAGPQAPTVFKKLDFYTQDGDEMKDRDAQLILNAQRRPIVFSDEDDAFNIFAVVEWDRITGVTYENSKHARITAGLLVAWPLLFLSGKKHWLTITFGPGQDNSPGGYAYARMDKDNFQTILAAINGFTGREIRRIEENGEISTLYPGTTVTQVQPAAPTQPEPVTGTSTNTTTSRPAGTISVGALPPITPTWAPPVEVSQSAAWTTRDADGVGFEWSVIVSNGNDAPMRAIATIVLRETTGGALHTTYGDGLVPPNATHELSGTGTVPNEAANSADFWTIDIAWDLESLPTSPTPTTTIAPIPAGTPGLIDPVLLNQVLPEYPAEEAARKKIEGDVIIEAVVKTDGTLDQPKLVQGIGDGELNIRAIRAVLQWTFRPGVLDGRAVPVRTLFTVTYRIQLP